MKKAYTYFCVSKNWRKFCEKQLCICDNFQEQKKVRNLSLWQLKINAIRSSSFTEKTSSILTFSMPINPPKQLVKCWKKSVIKNRLEVTLENEEICERSWLRGWGIDGITGLGLIHGAAFLISAVEKPKRGINYAAFPTISFLVKLPRSFRITAINRRSRACGLMFQSQTERVVAAWKCHLTPTINHN